MNNATHALLHYLLSLTILCATEIDDGHVERKLQFGKKKNHQRHVRVQQRGEPVKTHFNILLQNTGAASATLSALAAALLCEACSLH